MEELLITAKQPRLINTLLCVCRKAEDAGSLSKRFAVTTQFSDKVKWWLSVGILRSSFTGVLKELAEKPWTVNKSLNMGEVLEDWKKANIVPVI